MVDFNAMNIATKIVKTIESTKEDYDQARITADEYDKKKQEMRVLLYSYISKANKGKVN